MLRGIDVSRWQGTINWGETLPSVDFVIAKATGGDQGLYTDGQFHRNRTALRNANKPRGYYHFAGGGNPRQEAEYFASVVGPLQNTEIVVLDWERPHSNPVGWSLEFMVRLEELVGVGPMFYTNMNRVWTIDWTPLVKRNYGLWGAIFDNKPDQMPDSQEWPFIAIKQWTADWRRPGIAGPVDGDTFNGDNIAAFLAYGKRGGSTPAPIPTPIPQPPVMQPKPVGNTYTIKSGDTLGAVAAKYFGGNLNALLALNPHFKANPDKIFPGQLVYLNADVPSIPGNLGNGKYVVKPGDTLSKIAGQFNISWQQLHGMNAWIKDPNTIQIGWVLNVPGGGGGAPAPAPAPSQPTNYTIRGGDNLSKISGQFGTSIEQILAWNKPKYPSMTRDYIQAGWTIRVK